jgi:hypothetical protein
VPVYFDLVSFGLMCSAVTNSVQLCKTKYDIVDEKEKAYPHMEHKTLTPGDV